MSTTSEEKEKIVSLNEDLQGHKHDDASFEKALKNQEALRKDINENKK